MEGVLKFRIEELDVLIDHEQKMKNHWDRMMADRPFVTQLWNEHQREAELCEIKLSAYRQYRQKLQRQFINECRSL